MSRRAPRCSAWVASGDQPPGPPGVYRLSTCTRRPAEGHGGQDLFRFRPGRGQWLGKLRVDVPGGKLLELAASDVGDGPAGERRVWIGPELRHWDLLHLHVKAARWSVVGSSQDSRWTALAA